MWLKIESTAFWIFAHIIPNYMIAYSLPSAVTLSNKMLGYNELQYEIWADIMNINADAAQSQKEGSEIVELESSLSACSKVYFR